MIREWWRDLSTFSKWMWVIQFALCFIALAVSFFALEAS